VKDYIPAPIQRNTEEALRALCGKPLFLFVWAPVKSKCRSPGDAEGDLYFVDDCDILKEAVHYKKKNRNEGAAKNFGFKAPGFIYR
jgi:hypothetical protein